MEKALLSESFLMNLRPGSYNIYPFLRTINTIGDIKKKKKKIALKIKIKTEVS